MAVNWPQVWNGLMLFSEWVGGHSTKIAAAARAGYFMAVGFGWTHLTLAEVGLIGGFAEAVLAVFVESTTVSKSRVGERIDAEVAKQMSATSVPGGGNAINP